MSNEEAEPPAETKVRCCNLICRWIGCCDVCSNGDGPPNLREGVLKKRACTDIPWFLGCIIFSVVVFITIWTPAINNVDMNRFYGASDYQMNTCGYTANFTNYKYAAWPDIMNPKVKVCISNCSMTKIWNQTSKAREFDAGEVFYGYCVPEQDVKAILEQLGGSNVADIYSQRKVPIAAIGFTFVYLFIFFIFVYLFLKWILIALYLGVLVATAFGSYFFLKDGYDFESNAMADPTAFYIGVGILVGGILLWCCMMCFWTTLFGIIDKMQMASKAILAMPHLMMVPMITFPFVIAVLSAFCIISVFMFSSGKNDIEQFGVSPFPWEAVLNNAALPYVENESWDKVTNMLTTPSKGDDVELGVEFFIHLFWMFWGLKIIEFFNFLVIAGCVADWYLDKELVDNPESEHEFKKGSCGGNCCRIFKAMYRAVRYHLGTIAFAAALVAAIQTAEAILVYIKRSIGETENPFAKLILKITMAVMKCLECIMNRCSKSTLVVTAVLGSPFCAGCGKTLQMFFNNMATMGLGTGMIMFLCLLANIVIALLSGGTAGAIYLGVRDISDVQSHAMPLVFSVVCSFLIARVLLTVWDCAATTVLVSGVMLKEWYPDEYEKHLGRKAVKVDRPGKNDVNEAEQIEMP